MFIDATGEYVPERAVDNEYFSRLTGRPTEWFGQLTGIRERRRAGEGENTNTMAIAAVEDLLARATVPLNDIDLVIGASYTPWDTIATMAHVVQRRFNLQGAKALYLSTACSSFIDAVEVAYAYFQVGRAHNALVVAAEHNSLYSSDADDKSGHLWGDGAAAVLFSPEPAAGRIEVLDVHTVGLADRGRGPEAICCAPNAGGLVMAHGKDIFMHACREMAAATRAVLERNQLTVSDIQMLVPHQANKRIIDSVIKDLGMPEERVALTITELGNTGCASAAITLHRFAARLQPGQYAIVVTFGGGYSAGTLLLRRCA